MAVVHRDLYEEQILTRTTVGLVDLDDTLSDRPTSTSSASTNANSSPSSGSAASTVWR